MTEKLESRKLNIWQRLISSPLVLIVVFLLAVDGITTGALPAVAPDWYLAKFPNPEKHCVKALNYLSDKENPHVVLLGSSLMRTAAEASDLPPLEEMGQIGNNYDKANFFKAQLKKDAGVDLQILNIAMRGCMASDYYVLLKKAIEVGKQPQLVICGTAPAEFMSNDQPVVGNTYVHQAMSTYKFPQGRPFWELIGNDVERIVSPHSLQAVEQVLAYYRVHFAAYLSDTTGHPTDLFRAAAYGTGKTKSLEPMLPTLAFCGERKLPNNPLGDLEHYRLRYHPPNAKLFAEHSHNFAEMMRLSHDNAVPLVVINMPITAPNKALIDPQLLKRYYDFMENTAKQYNVTYINMDNRGIFELNDFRDSSHLNSSGGKKFFTALAQELVKQNNLSSVAAGSAHHPL